MQKSHYLTLAKVEGEHWWFVAKRNVIKRFMPKMAKKLLDIGAGTGGLIKHLRAEGIEAVGIEASKIGIENSGSAKPWMTYGQAEKLPWRANSFEVVTCIDVLYHKGVPVKETLAEMRRVLKPGGTMIVFDCAFNWLAGPHDIEVEARERFTREKLVRLVKKSGMKIQYSSYVFFFLFPMIVLSRLADRLLKHHTQITTPSPLLNRALITLMRLETYLMQYVSWPWGSSIVVVAKKPIKK
jgi:SAM-dependent methyltransferase